MKHIYLLAFIVLFLTIPHRMQAQKVLFVNDNGLQSMNTDTVMLALTAANIDYDVFNSRDSLRSPTAAEMNEYPLVIWYCSTDGVGTYFWNGDDSDNIELDIYLALGGELWLMGADVLYDRYGSAPESFVPGDFVYDYLGVETYAAQSYGDDGGLGVAELDPKMMPPGYISSTDTITWIFPTAWWVDGCVPTSDAVAAYVLGPESYSLSNYSPAILNSYTFFPFNKELSFFFDPAIMDSRTSRVNLFKWAMQVMFVPVPPGVAKKPHIETRIITGPNPATGILNCGLPDALDGKNVFVTITAANGSETIRKQTHGRKQFDIIIASLTPGVYFIQCSDGINRFVQKFIVGR